MCVAVSVVSCREEGSEGASSLVLKMGEADATTGGERS